MKTETTEHNVRFQGEIFYDAECPLCIAAQRRVAALFERRGFRWVSMQTAGTTERLGISEAELRREMKLLPSGGKLLGGIDSWIYLFNTVWWLRAVAFLLRLPGVHWLANSAYAWLATHRHCLSEKCGIGSKRTKQPHTRSFLELP